MSASATGPAGGGWRDDFKARQAPDVRPVDDLSMFVMGRIGFTENGPKHEVPQVYDQPVGPMAHRYAAEVRLDMVAFRRILELYCDWSAGPVMQEIDALRYAVKAIAMRWSDHPDFQDDWRV